MADIRLPKNHGDEGSWGLLLNKFLSVAHNPDGTLRNISGNIFNVQDYGAKGDGSTDDTQAIQDGIDAIGSEGGTLYFPATQDEYIITASLNLSNKDNTIIDSNSATIKQNTSGTKAIYVENSRNIVIKNLRLVGMGDYTGVNNGARGIWIDDSDGVRVCFCKIELFGNSGILWQASSNIYIQGNRIVGPGSQITEVIQGDSDEDGNHNFGINGYERSNSLVAEDGPYPNVMILNNTISEVGHGIYVSEQENVGILGNQIMDVRGQHGMYLHLINSVVANNRIDGARYNGIKLQVSDKNEVSIENVVVEGNSIRNAAQTGIELNASNAVSGYNIQRCLISDNAISDCGYGIAGNKLQNVNIANNGIFNSTQYGIITRESSCDIVSNRIIGCGYTGIYHTGNDEGSTNICCNRVHNSVVTANEKPASVSQRVALFLNGDDAQETLHDIMLKDNIVSQDSGASQFMDYALCSNPYANLSMVNNHFPEEFRVYVQGPIELLNANSHGEPLFTSSTEIKKGRGPGRDFHGEAMPIQGNHFVGDKVWNTVPAAGDYVGWVCVASGTPGTWKPFGKVES